MSKKAFRILSQNRYKLKKQSYTINFESSIGCTLPSVKLYGNTTLSNNNPTPESPATIYDNEHTYRCCKKNLLPYPYASKNGSNNGVNYVVKDDGSVECEITQKLKYDSEFVLATDIHLRKYDSYNNPPIMITARDIIDLELLSYDKKS